MTSSEIGLIMYDNCRQFGVETEIKDNMPFKELKEERIVILPSNVHSGRYWHECVVKINWCTPDIDGEANGIRLEQLETELKKLYKGIGESDGRYYVFRKSTTDTVRDADMRCHYANLTLSFKIQNIN